MTETETGGLQRVEGGTRVWGWVVLWVVVGTVIRLGIASVSYGTNDMSTWGYIGNTVAKLGLLETYVAEPTLMNHPPVPVIWARLAVIPRSPWLFGILMKLPAIVGDGIAAWLLAMIWTRRGNLVLARSAVVAMALSPVAILVSGYHCNTDNLYAALGLLAVYLATDRRRYFMAGLALGAAINVKLIPVLLIPVLFSLCRGSRDVINLVKGLALMAIPFLPLLGALEAVHQNMIKYVPPESDWGVTYVLHDLMRNRPLGPTAAWILQEYRLLGRFAIIIAVLAICIAARWLGRWNGYERAALVYGVFLLLAPGFGPQYLVIVVPILLAISIGRTWVYGTLAGVFAGLMYAGTLVRHWPDPRVEGGFPLLSVFGNNNGYIPGAPIGFLAWWVLLGLVIWIGLKRSTGHDGLGATEREQRARA